MYILWYILMYYRWYILIVNFLIFDLKINYFNFNFNFTILKDWESKWIKGGGLFLSKVLYQVWTQKGWGFYILKIPTRSANVCLIAFSLRDDTPMTSLKIVQFSRLSTPLSIYVQNTSTPLTLDVQFQTIPLPSRSPKKT